MAGTFLRLLVLFLGISNLICLNAIPITRIGRLTHGPQVLTVSETTHMVAKDKNLEEHENLEERIAAELNDYPGSGANHRHTPWPPQLRCADC
ncbi:uncharacterized protein LOC8263420 [Ricinus communis]|uniref:Uncharacterized protein n=1 Tax=Ricinus communis TaxID=3988 RepID=B9RLX8_RICCO|nr:uncharacterized protein LOC8263420 [Ricinus communis]EEF47853.1 conserved hypothetical protein [Ricinus communis]|eukprot:XP_002514747.1 uncharacterized protein LOC8263420 [Ricinus communis]